MSPPPSQPHAGEPYPAPSAPDLAQPGPPYGPPPTTPAPSAYPEPAYFPAGYQQPGYQQPGYQQPGYQQPGYPQSGPAPQGQYGPGAGPGAFAGLPAAPAAAPRRTSPVLPILLGAVAVLLILCSGGIAAAFVLLKPDADGSPGDPNPVGTAPGPRRSPSGAGPTATLPTPVLPPAAGTPTAVSPSAVSVQLLEPARLNGRPKLTDPQFAGAAKQLQKSLSLAPGATDSIGALYGDPAKRNVVVVAAVAAPIPDPDRELSATLLGAGTAGTRLTGVVTVAPGPLGGKAQCGNSSVAGVKMAMCAWADAGSVGWFIWYFKSADQVRREFVKLRGLIEKTT